MSRPTSPPEFQLQRCLPLFPDGLHVQPTEVIHAAARTVSATLVQFRKTSNEEAFEILAYCLMPDHAHFLIEGLDDRSDFRRFCKLAKQRSGSAHARSRADRYGRRVTTTRVLRENEDLLHYRAIPAEQSSAGWLGGIADGLSVPWIGALDSESIDRCSAMNRGGSKEQDPPYVQRTRPTYLSPSPASLRR